MNKSQMTNEQYGLFFDVRRSIRYHDRRRSFFELMHRITAALTILMAGSILFDIGKTGATAPWLVGLSVFAAVLATFDMVVGYASQADLHRSLKVRFGNLEMAIVAGGSTQAEWDEHQLKRLTIELDEPAVYRALDILCYNEVSIADGVQKENLRSIDYISRATCHIFHWSDIANSSK
ncbi:MAG: hypothetical protein HOP21_01410 [Methylotenera sp.]|nr:hypothetical protein [Methylotenera sp.]